jgi:hypothetical protein
MLPTLVIVSVLSQAAPAPAVKHALPGSTSGDLVVGLCDGQTSAEVKGVKDPSQMTPEQGRALSEALMRQWRAKHPGEQWEMPGVLVAQGSSQQQSPPAQNPAPKADSTKLSVPAPKPQTQQGTYQRITSQDEAVWAASTEQLVAEGKRVFHDANAFGGTIAVSCDMCHPDAANTHPETYPKFQVQLGRVALLRDMINWCIENPGRGVPLADDDPRLRAMEAYIYASRKGVKLEYGKR